MDAFSEIPPLSPTSREAMFIAAYMARQWQIPLKVVSIRADGNRTGALDHAQQSLQTKNFHADFVERKGNPAYEMLQTAKQNNCNLIVMGSYGNRAILEIALGSTVDEILRSFRGTVMVCR